MGRFSAVIIGAGMAGCAAARTLIENGIEDIVILEATDRIGGRVKTVTCGKDEQLLEFGAQWIHGDVGNPIYEEYTAHTPLTFNGEYLVWAPNMADTRNLYDLWGRKISKKTFNKGLQISQMLDESIENNWDEQEDITHFKDGQFKSICQDQKISTEDEVVCRKMLRWVEKTNKAEEGSETWDRSEIMFDYGQYDDCGNRDYSMPEGVWSIFTRLLLPHMADKVNLGVEVTKVNYDHPDGVEVITDSGDKYLAEHVIVTPSVNYLKKNQQQMFSPALPEDKSKAINEIWMGVAEKLILYYENPFWLDEVKRNNQFQGYSFLLDEENEKKLMLEMADILGKEADWWKFVVNIQTSICNPNILTVMLTNESAEEASHCSDRQVVQVIHTLLNHFTGLTAPKPTQLFRTNWFQDKHFLGSYSSELSKHFRPEHSKTMLDPVVCQGRPVLLFAGEAYHPKWMSTMHGAFDSGRTQARRVAEYLKSSE